MALPKVAAAASEALATPPGVAEAQDGEDGSGAVQGYVVSIVGRRRFRRLHFVGLCGRVPGIDYLDFAEYGDLRPSPEDYDAICRKCWKSDSEWAAQDRGSITIEDSEEDSTSSSESDQDVLSDDVKH